MRLLVLAAALLVGSAASAQDVRDPNSPDFDPVARMQRFFPNWQPPAVSQEALTAFALGSAQRPVRSQGPQGQQEYLARLLCRNGKPPKFKRIGSMGPSPYGYPMDAYEVSCGWSSKATVHMDLYHPRYVEREPVPGFTLRD